MTAVKMILLLANKYYNLISYFEKGHKYDNQISKS